MAEQQSDGDRKARRNKKKKEQSDKAKSWFREWVDAFIFAAIAAIIIRTFLFEAYRIPTPSMEETLLTGDFLVVSKISYGARTPMVLGIPFTNVYLPGVMLPWTRLPGLTEVRRNDIVVFNYPIDLAPIAAKTNYIKRAVGMPGDTLSIDDNELFVNGSSAEDFPGVQKMRLVQVREGVRLSPARVQAGGASLAGMAGPNTYRLNATDEAARAIETWPEVTGVRPWLLPDSLEEYRQRPFSFSRGFLNHHHMPPVVVPFEGQQVSLTSENYHIYENIITRYEGNNVRREGEQFIINGERTNSYTIRQAYYFMMGDNRDDSEDSRFWGFVPRDHVVGKAGMIYFSWDAERWMPRFNRLLNMVHR